MASGLITESEWVFPPALNATFVEAYWVSFHKRNTTVPGVISDAVSNLTAAERIDAGYPITAFGSNDAVLRVGDVLEVDWKGGGNRIIGLDCTVCTVGAEDGFVENACDNYTRTANIYRKVAYPPASAPHSDYAIPSLQGILSIENKTCALCVVSLFSPQGMDSADVSVPFPVLQQSAYPHKRFSAEHPTGIEDTTISVETTVPLQEPVEHDDGPKINVGMIVGVVVGVLMGMVLLALLYWWLWKKRKSRAKVVDSPVSSTADQGMGDGNRTAQGIALQRIQGVVRRPETSASEVPPPYHEAVQSGNTLPANPMTRDG